MLCVVINLVLNLTLVHFIAHVGMALATSIASWVNTLLLGWTLYKRGLFKPDAALRRRVATMALAAKVMGVLLMGLTFLFAPFSLTSHIMDAAMLGVSITIGGIVYLALVWVLGGIDKDQVRAIVLRRNRMSPTPADELEG